MEGFLLLANSTTVSTKAHLLAWLTLLAPRVTTHISCLLSRSTVSSALWLSHQVSHASNNSSVNTEGGDDACTDRKLGCSSRMMHVGSGDARRTFTCCLFFCDITERVLIFTTCGCRFIVVTEVLSPQFQRCTLNCKGARAPGFHHYW